MPRRTRKIWTPAELAIVRARYPHVPTIEIATQLRRPVGQVYQCAARLGLKKSEAYLASPEAHRFQRERALTNPRIIANQFKKGQVPANKGLRRPGYAVGRMADTQFKKGRAPHEARNYKPIGTLRIDPKDHYLQRKVTDDPSIVPAQRWVGVHRLVWEAAPGRAAHRRRQPPDQQAAATRPSGPWPSAQTEDRRVKNKIEDLRNHLFATLEGLQDTEKPMDIDRAKAVAEVAKVIVDSAKVEVEYVKATGSVAPTGFVPLAAPPSQRPALRSGAPTS